MNEESNRVEYKEILTNDLERQAVAFLNYNEGGIIYIGIDKNNKVAGVADIDLVQLSFNAAQPRTDASFQRCWTCGTSWLRNGAYFGSIRSINIYV